MSAIICYDSDGNPHSVAAHALQFRPAAYGIFIENNQILLVQHPDTHLWYPPGTPLNPDETPKQAVRHFFRQATGMTPQFGPLVFIEDQYLFDEQSQGWHYSVMYYALSRPTGAAASQSDFIDGLPHIWLNLNELQRHQLQFGYEAIQAARLTLQI